MAVHSSEGLAALGLYDRLLPPALMPDGKNAERVIRGQVVNEVPDSAEIEPAYTRVRAPSYFAPMPGCSASNATASRKSVATAPGAAGRFSCHHLAA